jgi:translation initiation factor 2B subunit (eIF-2B alpha/beta/delta family)
MPFDYMVAAAIAKYDPVHTEKLRDFAYAARQTWDELQLSKRENISLQREIRNLLGEIDVLKSSLLEIEATPQPAVDVNQQLVEALKACEECLTFIHGGEPLRTDVPLKLARKALLSAGKGGEQP